jgi:hypothetical protein
LPAGESLCDSRAFVSFPTSFSAHGPKPIFGGFFACN